MSFTLIQDKMTFKPNTNDMRDAPLSTITHELAGLVDLRNDYAFK